jgi:transcriptional regulator with XRE-family HTH domain
MYRNLEQWSMIRRRVLEEGISQRQAARETGINRNTIRKMLQYKCPQPSGPRAPRYPKLGPFANIIDQLITANVSLPLDARLSIKAIHNYLQREAGLPELSFCQRLCPTPSHSLLRPLLRRLG